MLSEKVRRWWPDPVRDVVLNGWLASPAVPDVVRALGWARYGARVARSARIRPRVVLGGRGVTVGEWAYVNHGALIDDHVTLGEKVFVGPGARILTATHRVGGPSWRAGEAVTLPVVVGDGCWVGAGAIILPGVTVAPGCVIGAGAVVAGDTARDGLYVGVPARRVRDLPGSDLPDEQGRNVGREVEADAGDAGGQ